MPLLPWLPAVKKKKSSHLRLQWLSFLHLLKRLPLKPLLLLPLAPLLLLQMPLPALVVLQKTLLLPLVQLPLLLPKLLRSNIFQIS